MSAKNSLRHFAAVCARIFHLWPLISRSGLYNYARRKKYPDTLVYLDVVITECCTLKCRDCSNLMQYYNHPENLNIEEQIRALRRLLKSVRVAQLKILGGEPFVCQKNLITLLEFLGREATDRVDEIVIITNGTLIPSDETLKVIKETPKTKVLFSDYGEVSSKLKEFSEICSKNGIESQVVETEYWWDFGDLKLRDEKASKAQRRYDACYSRKHCNTLFRGKFYLCPRQAHGVHLGLIPDSSTENIDILQDGFDDPLVLHDAIYRLIERKERITPCSYCSCDSQIKIPRAVQTERPSDVS